MTSSGTDRQPANAPAGGDPQPRQPVVYSVAHPTLESGRAAIVEVCDRNLPGENHLSRFQWYYCDNPLGRGDVFLLSASTAGMPPSAVGCTGMAPRVFTSGGTRLRALLSADFAVDRQHRTVLPAVRLQRAAYEEGRPAAEVLYGFPNFRAVGVFERVGYKVLGRMQRYVKVLRAARYLRRVRGLSLITPVAGAVIDTVQRVVALRRRALPRALRFRWLGEFDARFDCLGELMATQTEIVGVRTAAWLKWRYLTHGGAEASIAALEDGAELRAYAVVVRKRGTARVADFGAATPDDLSALLGCLPAQLRRRGFEAAELYFLGPEWVESALREHDFRLRDAERAIVVAPGAAAPALPMDPRSWYLTWADADT